MLAMIRYCVTELSVYYENLKFLLLIDVGQWGQWSAWTDQGFGNPTVRTRDCFYRPNSSNAQCGRTACFGQGSQVGSGKQSMSQLLYLETIIQYVIFSLCYAILSSLDT